MQKEMAVVVPLDPVTAIAAAVSDLATMASSRRDSIQRAAEVAEIEIKEGGRTLNNVKKKNKNASEWDRNYFGRTSILSKARDVIKVGIPLFFLNCIIINVVCSSFFFLLKCMGRILNNIYRAYGIC